MNSDKIKKVLVILLLSANVVFVAAAYYLYQDNISLKNQNQEISEARDSALTEKIVLENENDKLLNRIQSSNSGTKDSSKEVENLEKLLNLREEEIAQLKNQLENNLAGSNQRGGRDTRAARDNNSREDRMRRFREENPEQFQRMQERVADFRQQREDQQAKRELFFKSLDLSKCSAEERRKVSEYQDMLIRSEEMAAAMWNPENRQQVNFRDMMEQAQELQERSEEVREILLQNLEQEMLSNNRQSLPARVNEIIENTSIMGRFSQRSNTRRGR